MVAIENQGAIDTDIHFAGFGIARYADSAGNKGSTIQFEKSRYRNLRNIDIIACANYLFDRARFH